MSTNPSIHTFHAGRWHDGNVAVIGSADHGSWLGTLVFDGARRFDGVSPDLFAHCDRINRSAACMGLTPTWTTEAIVDKVHEGLARFKPDLAIYIRPMYWSRGYGEGFIAADPDSTDFALCLQEVPMPSAENVATLTTTRFSRPTLDVATVDAKAACLYPNNARMIREAISKGFTNALVTDQLGNVAETATSNVFMVRDGEVFTPVPNGCFLTGITRARVMSLLQEAGIQVHQVTLSLDDFRQADEVFLTGNLAKVTPVTQFDDRRYESQEIAQLARSAYMDWAHSEMQAKTV